MVELKDRDFKIFREVERFRYCLGRHIKFLADFPSVRTCDRRLSLLIAEKYLDRKKMIYGVSGVYTLTYKTRLLISADKKPEKIRLDNIIHDITVLDTAIYFMQKMSLALTEITTEKQLHQNDGFGNRKHHPDFVINKDGKKIAVEIELTQKSKSRFEANIKSNFIEYDKQVWVIPDTSTKIYRILQDNKSSYPNISILELKEIKDNVH